jgi:Zn-dependent protease with chaperone function
MLMLRTRLLSGVVATVMVTAACAARQPGEPLRPGFNMFSKEQDIQLGREAAAEVRQQVQVVQNDFLQDYVSRIGQRLASQPEAGGFPYSFTLVNDKSINAFALPGGPLFMHTGLIAEAENEAQLAGVVAHEIAHVALRHGTNQVSKANLIQLPAMVAGAVVGNGSILGQLAQVGIGLGANSILLKYSRDAENQADALGARLMAKAGYNPLEMARFFEKLEAEGGARGPQFLSSHPNPGNRVRSVQAEIRTIPQASYGFQTGQFSRAKSMVAQLPAPRTSGTSSRAAPPDGQPTGEWRQLRGKSFAVSHPGNWQAFGDNQSSMVTIAPREGLVQGPNGGTAVGYGAILSYFFPDQGSRNLRQATEDLIHHLQTENPGMEVASGNQRRIRVDGSEALVTMLRSSSPYGGAETDALLTVARPEGLFYMVFVAPQNNFQQLEGTFQQMLNSIRFS